MTADGPVADYRPEISAGMRISWDVPIVMDDGMVLRADVFRPDADGQFPVIMTYGPYAKGLPFERGYPSAWQQMLADHPDVVIGTSGRYQNWEVVDPEKWVPDGYACVRVDSRGTGRSPGYIDLFSMRETQDYVQCIEWAGTQPWSTGKVGLCGISYYAMNQWLVASQQPPHLTAICPWEGSADWYRDATYHGGIRTTFWDNWYDMQVKSVQYGLGEKGGENPNTGQAICGDLELTDAEMVANRTDFGADIQAHPFDDAYHRERSPIWEKITVPVLSAGNWGGQGLHLRGNVEGFLRSASNRKWLEMHGRAHWPLFYADYGVGLQKRFFGYFLKGEPNGWDSQPPVQLNIRGVDGSFRLRSEQAWPIPRTRWTRLYLDAHTSALTEAAHEPGRLTYSASGDGLLFQTPPLESQTEITGPVAAKIYLESSTTDADVFLVVRVFAPDGEEVVFQGALDPHTPIAQGWLRASHRKLDPLRSEPYRPYHTHDEPSPLRPGTVYELDIEILPTCLVINPGYRIALSVRGRDYVYPGPTARLSNLKNELTGCGPFLHNDETNRPGDVYGGQVTVHTGGKYASYLQLPIVPET